MIVQEGFRWRNDDGDEDSATWMAAQDTDTELAIDGSARLRTIIDTTADETITPKLYYRKVVPTYVEEVLADSPVALWMLGETAGTNANDSGPNNLDGTYTGSYTLNAATIFGHTAVDLSSTGYVTIADNSLFSPQVGGSGAITLEALFKMDVLSGTQAIVTKGDGGNYEWALCSVNGSQLVLYIMQPGGGSFRAGITHVTVLRVGVEYHVVATYDQTTGDIYLYLNDAVMPTNVYTEGGTTAAGSAPVAIGRRNDGSWQIDGKVAMVAVYPTVLSAAQVSAHYAALITPSYLPVQVGPTPSGATSYRYYRWHITKFRTGGVWQASEFSINVGGTRQFPTALPYLGIGTIPEPSEGVAKLVDADTGSKALVYDLYTNTSHLYFDFDFGGSPVAADTYSWTTGADASDRDAVSWIVKGSNDGISFVTLDIKTDYATTTSRSTVVGPFSLTTPPGPVYVKTSANITAGGEVTTAQLTAPAGKTTADFSPGRMWDDENGLDVITGDAYLTEVLDDSPIAVWMLDETSGTNADDSGTNNIDGTYTGSYTLNATTIFGRPAVDLSPTSSGRVEIGDHALLSPQAGMGGTMSVEALINADPIAGIQALISKGTAGAYEWMLAMNVRELWFNVWESSGSNVVDAHTSGLNLDPGVDYHIIATYDRGATGVHIYLNNVDLSLASLSWSSSSTAGAAPVVIGRRADPTHQYDGKIAGVVVYDHVLSAARVAAHYVALGF